MNDQDEIYRELTEEEINNLSLELKICFHLSPWNHYFNPKNFDEWVEGFKIWYTTSDMNENLEHGFITDEEYDQQCLNNITK